MHFPHTHCLKAQASQKFTLSDTTPDCVTKLRKHQWTHEWSLPSASISFSEALHHAENTVSQISDSNLKDHLKATSILAKGLKAEISNLQGIDSHSSTLTGILNTVAKAATKSQINTLSGEIKDIVSTQQAMSQHLISLDTRVTGIESSLQQIISLLSGTDVKKGEKEETTKCTPDLQLRKDDNSGNDGGAGSASGTGTSSMLQGAKQSKQSKATAQSSSSRVKSKAKSQILMEEHQILTGDQILMPGQGQTLATIPEGDEDIIIDNSEDAANLFQKYKTKDGNVVTLYHQDKRVQQLFNRKALSLSSEDFPGMTQEEILKQQMEILESFNKESNPSTSRGRGRGRGRGGRRGGRKHPQPVSGQSKPSKSKVKKNTEAAPVLTIENSTAVRWDNDEESEDEQEQMVHRRRSRNASVTSTQIISTDGNPDEHINTDEVPSTDANPDGNPDPDTDPDAGANPDATPNPDVGDTDALDSVKVMVLTTVVDGHNKDIDEAKAKEKEKKRKLNLQLLNKIVYI